MKNLFATATAVVLASTLAAAQPAAKPKAPEPAPAVDYVALAEKMVGTSANVKAGEVVQILGAPSDLALLEELVLAVRKRGAFAILTLWSEGLEKRVIAEVPAKFDSQPPGDLLGLAGFIHARIIVPPVARLGHRGVDERRAQSRAGEGRAGGLRPAAQTQGAAGGVRQRAEQSGDKTPLPLLGASEVSFFE